MTVPYTFASATAPIPLSQLDSNFASTITLGNTAIQLGNTVTTLNNMTLANVTVSSGNVTVLNATVTNDASISGLTVGKGAGSVSTNTAVGASALVANTSGSINTSVGISAMQNNTSGQRNSALGGYAMQVNTTGNSNTGLGVGALLVNTTGSNNTAIGDLALQANTTASNNTAVGYQAGYSNTTGRTTAVGYQAGKNITTGDLNVCIGMNASGTVSGDGGIYIGFNSGSNNTTGVQNTYIGYNVAGSSSSVSYEIVLGGNNATGKGTNTGFINPNGGNYQGNNQTLWSVASDSRLKKNIVDNTDGLNKITALRVRNFEYRLPEEITELNEADAIPNTGVQLGVIAQEIQQVLPECVKTESTGVMSVDAGNLTWYLINAIKELNAKVEAQAVEIAALKAGA